MYIYIYIVFVLLFVRPSSFGCFYISCSCWMFLSSLGGTTRLTAERIDWKRMI